MRPDWLSNKQTGSLAFWYGTDRVDAESHHQRNRQQPKRHARVRLGIALIGLSFNAVSNLIQLLLPAQVVPGSSSLLFKQKLGHRNRRQPLELATGRA